MRETLTSLETEFLSYAKRIKQTDISDKMRLKLLGLYDVSIRCLMVEVSQIVEGLIEENINLKMENQLLKQQVKPNISEGEKVAKKQSKELAEKIYERLARSKETEELKIVDENNIVVPDKINPTTKDDLVFSENVQNPYLEDAQEKDSQIFELIFNPRTNRQEINSNLLISQGFLGLYNDPSLRFWLLYLLNKCKDQECTKLISYLDFFVIFLQSEFVRTKMIIYPYIVEIEGNKVGLATACVETSKNTFLSLTISVMENILKEESNAKVLGEKLGNLMFKPSR